MSNAPDMKLLQQAIVESVSESLETMAFSEAAAMNVAVAQGALMGSMATRGVSIPVDSPFSATLSIFYSPDLAIDLMTAMYGGAVPDGMDENAVAQDVMNEFVNTFVGRMICTIHPESPAMKLGFPAPIDHTEKETVLPSDCAAAFDIGGKLMLVRARM